MFNLSKSDVRWLGIIFFSGLIAMAAFAIILIGSLGYFLFHGVLAVFG